MLMAQRRAIGVSRRRWGRDGGAPAHNLGMFCAGRGGQVRQQGGRRHGGGAPEEALACAVERAGWTGRVRQVGPERGPRGILHHEDEAGAAGEEAGGAAFVVQRAQADAVILQAVDEGPGLGELEPGGNE